MVDINVPLILSFFARLITVETHQRIQRQPRNRPRRLRRWNLIRRPCITDGWQLDPRRREIENVWVCIAELPQQGKYCLHLHFGQLVVTHLRLQQRVHILWYHELLGPDLITRYHFQAVQIHLTRGTNSKSVCCAVQFEFSLIGRSRLNLQLSHGTF